MPPVYSMDIPAFAHVVSKPAQQDAQQDEQGESALPRRFLVPYDACTGLAYAPSDRTALTVLDLSDGAKVCVNSILDRMCAS